ncbi:MAG TPA: hypothetical protein VFU78_17800 [Thermomicrobiales bacterium]|nr:hypothetical protein [Thermomicrobiales bacterium]
MTTAMPPEPMYWLPGDSCGVTVFTATGLETWAARRRLPPGIRIEHTGVALRAWSPRHAQPFVSCGLAGGLDTALAPGTIVIPTWVGLPTGERLHCHALLVAALVTAACRLGYAPVTAPLLTTPRIVTGAARWEWYTRGYAAADMETGLLLSWRPDGAAVRVILDTPARDLSPAWTHPLWALCAPRHWPEAVRLGLAAPAYALRAAAVVAEALRTIGEQDDCRQPVSW